MELVVEAPQRALGSSLWGPHKEPWGARWGGPHKEAWGARCGGPTRRPGELVVEAPQGALGSSLWGLNKEAWGARCGGPQGGLGSSLWGPTRRPQELVAGAHKEAWGALCGGPRGGPGSSLRKPARRPGELAAQAQKQPGGAPGETREANFSYIYMWFASGPPRPRELTAGPEGVSGSSWRDPERQFFVYIYAFCERAPRHQGGCWPADAYNQPLDLRGSPWGRASALFQRSQAFWGRF